VASQDEFAPGTGKQNRAKRKSFTKKMLFLKEKELRTERRGIDIGTLSGVDTISISRIEGESVGDIVGEVGDHKRACQGEQVRRDEGSVGESH